ncbi:hypothetical protein B4102_0723 [Heyndrickxia sporothermodurans]|uniref:Uncharacterized protein n=1 Tax=Heyndrickxia sporothermodurans TaxID=46224 RepID=A0A150L8G8_9BACI|nr:hypothetical protein B4102_0723 [Heyndrickxia sporothermodurans]
MGYFRLIREITTAITATINDPKVIISEMASYTVIISNHPLHEEVTTAHPANYVFFIIAHTFVFYIIF